MLAFRTQVVIRVSVIVALSLLLGWVIHYREWFFTPLVISMVILGITVSLIHYVEKTTRNLSQFLINIKQGGYTSTFGKNQSLNPLYKTFNDIIDEFQRISLEKESHYQYLQTLNENLGVGLISYKADGKLDMINSAAHQLLEKPNLQKIDDLALVDPELLKTVKALKPEERKVLKTVIGNELVQLSITGKHFKLREESYTLLLIQNLSAELEETELDAWQKLISVLTHEIMNSVTPIASLSEALHNQLKENKEIAEADYDNVLKSLETMELRSKGLMKFVNAYKEFSKSPELNAVPVILNDLFQRIENLLKPELDHKGIRWVATAEKTIKINGDRALLEQVLINLIKNAMEAVEGGAEPVISLEGLKEGGKTVIKVTDNGAGIPSEQMSKIFVPFFTTKKKGTGVGLSFARKVMRLHNGSISLSSNDDKTVFTLKF